MSSELLLMYKHQLNWLHRKVILFYRNILFQLDKLNTKIISWNRIGFRLFNLMKNQLTLYFVKVL